MPWHDKARCPSCDECGRYVSMTDLLEGRAAHRLITLETAFTRETWETLCAAHNVPSQGQEKP